MCPCCTKDHYPLTGQNEISIRCHYYWLLGEFGMSTISICANWQIKKGSGIKHTISRHWGTACLNSLQIIIFDKNSNIVWDLNIHNMHIIFSSLGKTRRGMSGFKWQLLITPKHVWPLYCAQLHQCTNVTNTNTNTNTSSNTNTNTNTIYKYKLNFSCSSPLNMSVFWSTQLICVQGTE